MWWADLWSAPQAVMWDPSGRTLWPSARLIDVALRDGTSSALEAELRQHYDRHGLNPKALLQLRWRVGDPGDLVEEAEVSPVAGKSGMSAARRRSLLRSLDTPS